MNFKTLFLGITGFFCFLIVDEKPVLEIFKEERTVLKENYEQTPTDSTLKKIHGIEENIIAHIAENGFRVAITIVGEGNVVEIVDNLEEPKVLATLVDGDTIIVLSYHLEQKFYVETLEGIRGFVIYDNFIPSVNSYPLEVLVTKTARLSLPKQPKEQEKTKVVVIEKVKTTPTKKVKKAAATYTPSRSYSAGCSSVRCSGRTKKGSRCRRTTTSCSGRCYQH